MHFFEIENTAFAIAGYSVSYVELIGTVFGLISVYFASKANILTWGTGIINELFLFLLFFQVHLYADVFLQVYFFVVTIYGWYNWNAGMGEKKIAVLGSKSRWRIFFIIVAASLVSGYFIKNIHIYLPGYFKIEAAYPFADSSVMIMSIVATVLLARKKIENWHLWIVTDAICVILYFKKEVYFLAFEYLIFLGLASYGLYNWEKQLVND
jgi:nicotinamide mononucleotide transporter